MLLRMNDQAMIILSSNVGIGGGYFKCYEEKHDIPYEERRGDTLVQLSKDLINRQFIEDGAIDISDEEYLNILEAVRASLEASVIGDDKVFHDILETLGIHFAKKAIDNIGSKSLSSVHKLLDYLECNAPPEVMNEWIIERKYVANQRMEDLLDDMQQSG